MHRRLLRTALFLAMSTLASAQPGQINVSVYPGSNTSKKDVQTLVAKGSQRLFNQQTKSPCGLNLTLKGPLQVSAANSVVLNDDYNTVCRGGALMHVVRNIAVCGLVEADTTEARIIYGCSRVGCGVVVDVLDDGNPDDKEDLAESQWMHEYAHTRGLPHRQSGVGAYLLMNPILDARQFDVSQLECDQIQPGAPAGSSPATPDLGRPATIPAIKDFVRQIYMHGVPLQQARSYTADEVATVTGLLASCAPDSLEGCGGMGLSSLPNIVLVTGLAGDTKTAFRDLQKFLDRSSPDNKWLYQARLAVPLAVGYLLRRNPDDHEALAFLENGAHPNTWKTAVAIPAAQQDTDASEMAKYSILGLGLIQHPKAVPILERLREEKGPFFSEKHVQKLLKQATTFNTQ